MWRRLGTPDAVSWPAFYVTLGLNELAVFTAGNDVATTFEERVVILLASQSATFWSLPLFRKEVLERGDGGDLRPAATLVAFALAGALWGLTTGFLLVVLGGAESEVGQLRLIGSVAAALILPTLSAVIVSMYREYRRSRE